MQPETTQDLDKRLSRLYAAPVPESFETGWRADVRREESAQTMKKPHFTPMLRRLAPVLCALVLAAGGLWAGTLENGGVQAGHTNGAAATRSAAAPKMAASYSLSAAREEAAYGAASAYDTAAVYDAAAADYGVTTYGARPQEGRKLVRTADLTIRSKAFDEAVEQTEKALEEAGGYIENLYQYGDTARRLSLSLRVPAEKLDPFLAALEGAGRVTDRSESTTDMTVQYADNQARLDTLYQKRERLNQMMEKAENVSDLIEIESAIADTQYHIDSYETAQRSIDRQTDMSAVTLTLIEEEQTVVNPEYTLWERIRAGFTGSVSWLWELARNTLVFTVMALPVIALIAVCWLGWKWIRRIRNRRK